MAVKRKRKGNRECRIFSTEVQPLNVTCFRINLKPIIESAPVYDAHSDLGHHKLPITNHKARLLLRQRIPCISFSSNCWEYIVGSIPVIRVNRSCHFSLGTSSAFFICEHGQQPSGYAHFTDILHLLVD